MTITIEAFTGTEAIGGTEWSLTADSAGPVASTDAGAFQPFVDLNAVAAGDTFRFAAYEKCRTGDTQRLVYTAEFSGVQVSPLWSGPPMMLGVGWDFTIKKIAGTDRTILWRISKNA